MTQTELAEKLGYKSKSSVAHIENGRDIPRSMVVTLAGVLDTTPSHLMGWDVPTEQTDAPRAQLLAAFDQLSAEGQQRVIDYAADLVASGRYKKTTADTVGNIA
jgi:transcriptional regulator with XRE-family HTH domain